MSARIVTQPTSARMSAPRPLPKRAASETASALYARSTAPQKRSVGAAVVPTVARTAAATAIPRKQLAPQRRVADDDSSSYTSDESYESSQFNSEKFQPLAFTLVKGGPKRAVGGVTEMRHAERSTVTGMGTGDSDSELSMDESPLSVHLQVNDTSRHCGRVQRSAAMEAVTSGVFLDDDSSVSSGQLPVIIEQRKRARTVGPTTFPAMHEVRTSEAPRALPIDSDEDEAPLNAEVIMNLVRRFRDKTLNPEEIPLEAFQVVNWDDDSFQPELAPLRRLYEYLEAMASLKKAVASPALKSQQQGAIRSKIKEVVMQLPTEQAIAAKVKSVKSRTVRSSAPKYSLYKSEFSEGAPAAKPRSAWDDAKGAANGTKGRPCDRGSAKAAQPTLSKVRESMLSRGAAAEAAKNAAPVLAEKAVTAAAGHKKKPKDNLISSMVSLGSSVIEGHMSASNSEIFKPGTRPLAAQKGQASVKESTMAEEPSRVRRAVASRRRNNANRSVSFTDAGFPEGNEEIVEREGDMQIGADNTKDVPPPKGTTPAEPTATEQPKRIARRKGGRRSQLGQSVSFASVPDGIAGEVIESSTAPEAASSKRSKPVDRRKRPAKSNNNRSCSFSDVQMDQAGEMVEGAAGADLPSSTPGSTRPVSRMDAEKEDLNNKGKKMILRRRPVARKIKKGLEVSAPEFGQAGEIDEGNMKLKDNVEEPTKNGPTKKKNRRRAGVQRNREISISQLDEHVAGEIYENADDIAYLNTGSRPPTGGPVRNGASPSLANRPASRTRDHRPRAASATAVQVPSGVEVPDDMEKAPGPDANRGPAKEASRGSAKGDAAKKRKVRKFTSQELSFSAIPDEAAGEIRENAAVYLEKQPTAEQQRRVVSAKATPTPNKAVQPPAKPAQPPAKMAPTTVKPTPTPAKAALAPAKGAPAPSGVNLPRLSGALRSK